eukprot:523455_1
MFPVKEKLNWTQDEIISFIVENAQKAESNIDTIKDDPRNPNKRVNGYDGIFLICSCHGYKNNIVTSDYQMIHKTAIHRLLSTNHAAIREIPRIVVFDCCDGSEERSSYFHEEESSDDDEEEEEHIDDKGKCFDVDDIETKTDTGIWHRDTVNPDYKLSIIHGANEGFQAKMNMIDGSYLIYELMKRMIVNIEENENLFLGEIVDGIQQYLHDAGKQQIISTFNNNTRFLKFLKNEDLNQEDRKMDSVTENEEKHTNSDATDCDPKHIDGESEVEMILMHNYNSNKDDEIYQTHDHKLSNIQTEEMD